MEASPLNYDLWVEQALRDVVRRALNHVAKQGLPADHHFYLTVKTGAPGVEMPEALRSQYPDEMTIVLQNQFWNLVVAEDAFEVTLSFSGVRSKLRVPFCALTTFADPAINFGLQMKPFAAPPGDAAEPVPARAGAPDAARTPKPVRAKRKPAVAEDGPAGGEVIALDAFRKK